ncbi:thioesterase II family protein [Paractinoplanes rishiriensis]|uniref:Thioesterase n=1 Tax=Paractinoplanes rishiriensis TaxID=1050105 RepID=A0A919MXZ6_9ACTN|nr:thioesterase [Actinoplanes rishiriensis]GIE99518.1 thioesterase [Actinoplanes rishiriensis]
MTIAAGTWTVPVRRLAYPRARLIGVPYAGAGAAAFHGWPAELPEWLELWAVRLPARETRIGEPPMADVHAVVAAVADALAGFDDTPYALYGHSMGALVAFELARELRRRGSPAPVRLCVSGRRAPQRADDLPGICHLPKPEFLAAVRRLNGIPEQLFDEPGLIDVLEPALRADFAVCERYRHTAEEPLATGLSVFGGDRDPTTDLEQLHAWRRQAAGPFVLRTYRGDHFFVHTRRRELLTDLVGDLGRVVSSTERA